MSRGGGGGVGSQKSALKVSRIIWKAPNTMWRQLEKKQSKKITKNSIGVNYEYSHLWWHFIRIP